MVLKSTALGGLGLGNRNGWSTGLRGLGTGCPGPSPQADASAASAECGPGEAWVWVRERHVDVIVNSERGLVGKSEALEGLGRARELGCPC